MKRLAQHSQYFLRSPRLIKELVGHTTIKKSDTVLDIGAGSGIISSVLAARCKQVLAYEPEPRMAKKLRENMKGHDNVTVIEKDFLTATLPAEPYKVFANIPFHLSSLILRKLTEAAHPPTALYLVVQKQFGQKLVIDNESFTGQLGAMVAPIFTVRIRRKLQRTDYWPHPAVDTVMVELLLREQPLIDTNRLPAYRAMVADCFADPKIFAKMPQGAAGITEGTKPSRMSLEKWVTLFLIQDAY